MTILKAMKKLALLFFLFCFTLSGFAKDPETKTFLLLFKSKELKNLNTTLSEIESQFAPFFSTKSYEGNSELALILEIPSCNFDECFLGEFLVELDANRKVQIQTIAFRLYDLSSNQKLIATYLALHEEASNSKKKSSKESKAASNP